MQRSVDQLVRDVRPVVLGGVDVIDTERHGPAQHVERGGAVARRPEDAGAGKLHRAEADAVDRTPGEAGSGLGHPREPLRCNRKLRSD